MGQTSQCFQLRHQIIAHELRLFPYQPEKYQSHRHSHEIARAINPKAYVCIASRPVALEYHADLFFRHMINAKPYSNTQPDHPNHKSRKPKPPQSHLRVQAKLWWLINAFVQYAH